MSGLLQWMTAISLIMHIAFFGISLLILKKSKPFVMPSPYIVNLVSPDTGREPASNKEDNIYGIKEAATEPQITTQEISKKPNETNKKEEQRLTERIAALKAKKRIERIEQARASLSLKSGKGRSGTGQITTANTKSDGHTGGSATDRYSKLVENEIRSHWVIPETQDKNIMAIISIKVTNDGSIKKIDFIKSSGNQLFDRSVQRAITKARLPQNPPDSEVELRFHP